MKQLITLVLALVLVLTMTVTAFADVLWIPDNLFLNQHMGECERSDRSYRALTKVTVYRSPEDGKVLWTIPEGDAWGVYYTYQDADGNLWGLVEDYECGEAGWIALAYTELVYDYISFEEDFGHTFQRLDEMEQLPEEYLDDMVIFWNYPGSESFTEFDIASWASEYLPEYHVIYEDTLGHCWGYVEYYYGRRNFWICLDNPTADYNTLYPAGTTPEVAVTEPGDIPETLPTEAIVPQVSQKTKEGYIFIAVSVLGCVLVSGALLLRAKKKSR